MLKKVFILFVLVVLALQYLDCNKEHMSTMRLQSTSDYPYDFATHIPTNYAINNAIKTYRYNNDTSVGIVNHASATTTPEPQPHNTCTLLPSEF